MDISHISISLMCGTCQILPNGESDGTGILWIFHLGDDSPWWLGLLWEKNIVLDIVVCALSCLSGDSFTSPFKGKFIIASSLPLPIFKCVQKETLPCTWSSMGNRLTGQLAIRPRLSRWVTVGPLCMNRWITTLLYTLKYWILKVNRVRIPKRKQSSSHSFSGAMQIFWQHMQFVWMEAKPMNKPFTHQPWKQSTGPRAKKRWEVKVLQVTLAPTMKKFLP